MFYAQNSKVLSSDREMKEAFRVLDDDFDGLVPIAKLAPVLQTLLTLDANRVRALLLQSYVREDAGPHNRDERGQAYSPDQWLAQGKMSYQEFVYFLES